MEKEWVLELELLFHPMIFLAEATYRTFSLNSPHSHLVTEYTTSEYQDGDVIWCDGNDSRSRNARMR